MPGSVRPAFGFLPGVDNAMNYRNRGNDGDHPKRGRHAVKRTAQDQQHQPLGPLHKSDFAGGNQRFGARARVTDHDRSRRGDGGQDDVRGSAIHGIVNEQAHVKSHIGIAVERGIEKSAKGRDPLLAPSHLAIQHVQKAGEEDHRRARPEHALGKQQRRPEIHE